MRTTRSADGQRCIVVGYGVQGHKRAASAGQRLVAVVDPVHPEATHADVRDVPTSDYDIAIVCTPDEPKAELLQWLVSRGKHVLVEKPLFADVVTLRGLHDSAIDNDALLLTAYNHRFEPHFVRMRDLIRSGELGRIYSCRMFYGNGTAEIVRSSEWRDRGAGVIPDLGSHLLDTCLFWFGAPEGEFELVVANRFENAAPDHAIVANWGGSPVIEFEMSLCMWRNSFTCDVVGENGSAHIESLCKWGPSTFTHRIRERPSGRPDESRMTLVEADPTWDLEFEAFLSMVDQGAVTDLSRDIWIQSSLAHVIEGLGGSHG